MTELLTAAQMRAIEQAAIASGEVTGLELMERAGQGVVEAIFEEWPELKATSHRAVVLCGPGNNGGDGFVVARLLHDWGWQLEVFLYGDPAKLPPDAKVNYERWRERGPCKPLPRGFEPSTQNAAIVIDAIFGIGLNRPIEEDLRYTLLDICDCLDSWGGVAPGERPGWGPIVVSIDCPAGICADSGKILMPESEPPNLALTLESYVVAAELTVTFHALKLGHILSAGPTSCGKVRVWDIGLDRSDGAVTLSALPRHTLMKGTGHKFSHGHALVVSGPSGKTGGARLAARGALRIGAGLVTVACEPEALAENAAHLTAIMLKIEPLDDILKDKRIKALCIGPGLGIERAAELIPQAVRAEHTPYITLDADALTALSRDPELFRLLNERCVLTPHAGEFARLFPDIAEKLAAPATKGPAYSKVDATREAAKRAGCVVLFKGPDTVIADPSGWCSINSAHYDRAAPWLATAGSGDVLAGFITGLMARGFAPMQAAETAAWLHVECALSFGPGLIAEDIPEELPKVFRTLGI